MNLRAPLSLAEVTPEFLTTLLSEDRPSAVCVGVKIVREIHGTATKALLDLQYGGDPWDLPPRMWLKAGLELHSEHMGTSGLYAQEVRAYRTLLPGLDVRRPATFGGREYPETRQGFFLLEDIGQPGAKLFTPESDLSIEDVADQIANLARMHAATDSPAWKVRHPWLKPVFGEHRDPGRMIGRLADPGVLNGLLDQPRARDYPAQVRDPERIITALDRLAGWLAGRPACLLHGDAHVGNTYRTPAGEAGLLDWQIPRWGPGVFDIAYYLVSALDVEPRRASEDALLAGYAAALRAEGGAAPAEADLREGYRRCLIYGFVAWLANPVALQPEHYNAIVSTRFAMAMIDHNVI